ncbi:zinc finger protein 276 [Heteronotia binoei]|uniref:zinc finger protein 276 n=1 Tax=Heteronotia binoei TaxID=13085 RepID=UPI00292FC73F|nr:zinc finger protein 276 [Heteronotia binoei]
MKRDRRGRFLPAAVAGRAGPEPEPQQQQSDAASRARRGRPAGRQQESSAPPPPPERRAPEEVGGIGRAVSTGYCRLCHGKFSSRSLRNAFEKVPMTGESSEKQRRLDRVFFTDFQHLVGVAACPDPALPQFVCKKCHTQFYKCRSILQAFIQKVNISPTGHIETRGKLASHGTQGPLICASLRFMCRNSIHPSPLTVEGAPSMADLITSSPQCLHNLVMWAHSHAESCQTAPSLQSVLSSEYCGIIRAVWGCGEGHDYVMSTDSDCSSLLVDTTLSVKRDLPKGMTAQLETSNGVAADRAAVTAAATALEPQQSLARTGASHLPPNPGTALPVLSTEHTLPECQELPSLQAETGAALQEKSLPQPVCPLNGSPGQLSEKPVLPAASDERVKDEFSDLSEGDSSSDNENDKRARSSDDSFEPYPEKKMSTNRRAESKEPKAAEEPKTRKKPGPKPGWKKKIKCEREELPTIYKCPYQGCTAVYRGADGMKKHIKEHHEEVRERPCPHPGCNKVFMIDRYLQRHVKLIHTEVRNYICDECGQTFKQRKHLSVHQMRHSGAKPLQCEICGFQCRQRASLKYHMTKHKAEAELEFACDQCGKRFEKAHNLNVHMSMVHPLIQTQDKLKAAEPEPEGLPDALEAADSQLVKLELHAQQEPT